MKRINLELGMTKAEVRKVMGRAPDCWSIPTRNYPEPAIWKYGDLELTFWTKKKYRVKYPGPVLIGVRDASSDDTYYNFHGIEGNLNG